MLGQFSKRLLSLLSASLLVMGALLMPVQALAAPYTEAYDPDATLSQFIFGQNCAQLDVVKDTNGFTHTKNNFYPKYAMDTAYQNVLFSLAKDAKEYEKLVKRFNKNWGGSCYGMASTMTLCYYAKNGYYAPGTGLSLSDMQPGAQSYSQITPPISNRNALNWINFYQASHCVSASHANSAIARASLLHYKSGRYGFRAGDINNMIGAAKAFIDGGYPFAFAYSYPTNNLDEHGNRIVNAHSIVGCDYYYAENGYFYLKFYDENDLGSHLKYGVNPRFCYIRFKYSGSNGNYTYSAPYKDRAGNDLVKIFYFNYAQNKYIGRTVNSMTVYKMTDIYNNMEAALVAHGLRGASANTAALASNGLDSVSLSGTGAAESAILNIDRVDEAYSAYRIEPFVYNGGNVNDCIPADSCGRLLKPANTELQENPYRDPDLLEDFEPETALPMPVDAEDGSQPFAHMPSAGGYTYNCENDSVGVELAITLNGSGLVGGGQYDFDGYDFFIEDGHLPGVSLSKGANYAWAGGEGIELVRFSSDGRLRDVVGDGNGELELYFGADDDVVGLDMFRFSMRGLGFLQVYDTEDDPDFRDCIVMRTNDLADGFDFTFYKDALESDAFEGVISRHAATNDIWIMLKAFTDPQSGSLGVDIWTQETPHDIGEIPSFTDTPPIGSEELHERTFPAPSGEGASSSGIDTSRNEYSLKGGAKGQVLADGSIRFTIDAPFEKHTGAAVDGVPLQKGVDYDAEKGSTVITLKPAFLASLKDGVHTLSVCFTDGRLQTNFTTPALHAPQTADVPAVPATGSAPWRALPFVLLGLLGAAYLRRRA